MNCRHQGQSGASRGCPGSRLVPSQSTAVARTMFASAPRMRPRSSTGAWGGSASVSLPKESPCMPPLRGLISHRALSTAANDSRRQRCPASRRPCSGKGQNGPTRDILAGSDFRSTRPLAHRREPDPNPHPLRRRLLHGRWGNQSAAQAAYSLRMIVSAGSGTNQAFSR